MHNNSRGLHPWRQIGHSGFLMHQFTIHAQQNICPHNVAVVFSRGERHRLHVGFSQGYHSAVPTSSLPSGRAGAKTSATREAGTVALAASSSLSVFCPMRHRNCQSMVWATGAAYTPTVTARRTAYIKPMMVYCIPGPSVVLLKTIRVCVIRLLTLKYRPFKKNNMQ